MVKKKWMSTVLFLVAVAVFGVILIVPQRTFVKDLRSAVDSDISYFMFCDLGTEKCQIVEKSRSDAFKTLLQEFLEAKPKLPPAKTPPSEKIILRLGRGSPLSKDYRACYQIVQYAGIDELFINDVAMNADCTRVDKYLTGSAALRSQRVRAFFR